MNQRFERVTERHGEKLVPVKHLYRRQYQTVGGQWSTLYYAIFVDWKGIRRRFPLGEHLDRVRNKLGEYRRKNDAEFDFDKDKTEREAREMTFSKWIANCAKSESDKRHLKHLEAFLGDDALSGIDDDHVKKYREKRSGEKIIRHGNASKKLVSQTTINKEVSTLRKFLRLARKKGFADKVTEFKMAPEKARKRILTDDEYKALLENCPAWLRRACVMAWETCLSRSDLLGLTWEEINLKETLLS
jgi:integrase